MICSEAWPRSASRGQRSRSPPKAKSAFLEALQGIGYPIATSCGGRASCGLCRLTIVSGREVLSPIASEEVGHLGNVAKIIGLRLACQARIIGDGEIVIEVPADQSVEARKRHKAERIQRERAQQRGRAPQPAGASAFSGSRDAAPAPGAPIARRPARTPEHKSRESGVNRMAAEKARFRKGRLRRPLSH